MKIGVFDSGLGGLFTTRALTEALPQYDYIYLGDTKRVPYGNRSHETIYEFLKEGVEFLFSHDCALVIVACNSASAEALRTLQQEWLPSQHPDKKVLGMIVPIVEDLSGYSRVGLIGTQATIHSGAYEREAKVRAPRTKIIALATPLLVPLIESGKTALAEEALRDYLAYFKDKDIEALILGCTHYPIAEASIKKILPENVAVISQNSVIPGKTRDYLARHGEIETALSRNGAREFCFTDITEQVRTRAEEWFGEKIDIKKVNIEK